MKKTALIFTCFLFISTCYAQILKIDNGISINSLKGKKFDLFPQKIVSYTGMVGVEYLQKKWFYLSSEIGYIKLGGKENSTVGSAANANKESWNYAQLNTSFRLRTPGSKTEFYLGAGPYLNILLGSGTFSDDLYAGYSIQKTNWGSKLEAGINENINKFRVGINCTYLLPFSPVAKSPYTSIDARSLAVYISLGYRMK
ncbi:hypothetical protein [Chitinophaga nivalis]|uniref:Outer membrane protein beta-barrel domain-containing protein n=1 Tax=Chitinophaga nivalis TaxID=2991709 RepID=A0ABT3IMT1_9BACT|nr:hypothetical protein [Chitinophaga nivalis]MCW3465274.1 hypothetical protein [Chitinophaga nivalis]MCW3485034.1 hypothetical protein [Chitinophaga nivalis]